MHYCKFCGEALPPDARFCASCGMSVSRTDAGQDDNSESPTVITSSPPVFAASSELPPPVQGGGRTSVSSANAPQEDSSELPTIYDSAPTVFAASSDLPPPVQGSDGGSQDATLTDEEEEERRRRLLGLPMLGALASEGQAPPANAAMVQGTPQVSGVPSVEGTPTPEHIHPSPSHLHHQPSLGFRPQTSPHASAEIHSEATAPQATAPQTVARRHAHWSRGLQHVRGRVLTVSVSAVVIVASVVSALVFLLPTTISLRGGGTVSQGGTLHLHGAGFFPGSRVTLTFDNHQPLFFVHTSAGDEVSSGGETLALSPEDATIMQALMAQLMRSAAHKSGKDSFVRVPISMTNVIQVGLSGTFDVAIPVSSSWSPGSHTIRATENISSLGVQSVQLTFTLEPTAARLVVAPVSLDFGMLK